MDAVNLDEGESKTTLATLNSRQLTFLSQVSQDIRTVVSHLTLPKVSPLSVLDSSAIDSLKDLYYVLNTEDPLNAMPVRRYILANNIPNDCLFSIAVAANSDPAAERNRKRWALPMYQTLRLLSVLTLPIASDCELPKPSQLDYLLLDLRAQLASHRKTLAGYVSLLQYYVDRKAEKRAALVPAEDAKLEDARIDNILRFFTNILSPPRKAVAEDILQRDRSVHQALVGSLVNVDFYSTLAVLFLSAEDASAHYTDLVFLVADIYALTYRHSSPRQMLTVYLQQKVKTKIVPGSSDHTQPPSVSNTSEPEDVFSLPKDVSLPNRSPENQLPIQRASLRTQGTRHMPDLRDALRRERYAIGGARAVTVSARWSSRHSGGFMRAVKPTADAPTALYSRKPNGEMGTTVTRILSAKGAIQHNKAFNPKQAFQESIGINSQILCQLAARGRSIFKKRGLKQKLPLVRLDLQEDGAHGLVAMTNEFLDTSFAIFVKELRGRITETKERAQAEEIDALNRAQRAFLSIVGSVVGFYRETCGKVYKRDPSLDNSDDDFSTQVHKNNLTKILESDFKIVKESWKTVEAAIELESFQLVFSVLVQACERTRESGKDESTIELVELSTFSVLEMTKMLQGMAAIVTREVEESASAKKGTLTPREVALNTLEQLFERESFLNAPADLAKYFYSKVFSFRHLCNIVEMAHAFTTILLSEQEFSKLSVAKRKRKGKAKKGAPEQETESGVMTEPNFSSKTEAKNASTGTTNDHPGSNEIEGLDSGDLPLAGDEQSGSFPSTNNSTHILKPQSTDDKAPTNECSNRAANDNAATSKNGEPVCPSNRKLSQVEMMLLADQETCTAEEDKPVTTKEPSRIEKMIMTDAQANTSGLPEPKYVTKLDGEGVDGTDLGDESDGEEDNLQEVESIGIVRRYAHGRAIETLMVPLRVALCQAWDLSGKTFPIPESAEILTQPVVVAKSACVLSSIWRVATKRERGALCGQFFSFSILQLLSIVLNAEAEGALRKESVLAHMCGLAKDVTNNFFKWLKVNPGVMYDLFLSMDKVYTISMARKVNGFDVAELELNLPLKTGTKRKKIEAIQKETNSDLDDLYDSDELAGIGGRDTDEEELVKKMESKAGGKSAPKRHTRSNPVPESDVSNTAPLIIVNGTEGRSELNGDAEDRTGNDIIYSTSNHGSNDGGQLIFHTAQASVKSKLQLVNVFSHFVPQRRASSHLVCHKMARRFLLDMIDDTPQQIAPDVFKLSAVFKVLPGVWVPVNMAIIRNPENQTLTLYSPLNPALYPDLSFLGMVTAIVAPSGMHSTYPQVAKTYYPSAKLFSAPTLQARFPDCDWGTLVTTETAEDVLGQHVRIRLASSCPFMAEIVLLHEPSQTLFVCDLAFNFTQQALKHASWLARFYIKVMGPADRPLDISSPLRAMIKPYCRSALPELDSLLEWPWTRVLPCHGDLVENAKPKFITGVYKFVKETAAKQREDDSRSSNYNLRLIYMVLALAMVIIAVIWNRYSKSSDVH